MSSSTSSQRSTVKDLCDKLLDNGIEPFLVWSDVVGHEEARRIFSEFASRILQGLPSIKPDSLKSSEWLDVQAMIFRKFGDLCLSYNFMTHSAARSCLEIALLDLSHNQVKSCMKRDDPACIRYDEALGILIAKLSCRLKFSSHYTYLDEKQEDELIKKLKKL